MTNGFEEALADQWAGSDVPQADRPCLCDVPEDGMKFVEKDDCPQHGTLVLQPSRKPVPCFHCNKELESAIPNSVRYGDRDWQNQPYDATTFHSEGQYGSTVWDPMNQHVRYTLEINICDDCLREASHAEEVTILLTQGIPQRTEWQSKPWDYTLDHRTEFD